MNAAADLIETPQSAARRLAAAALSDGYKPEALHTYELADGSAWCWRIRLKNAATCEKWMRPMYRAASGAFVLGEPPAPAEGKPIYRLPAILAAPDDAVIVVCEGEKCADALAKLGIPATTSGSADSAEAANWTPLHGRRVLIWPDNDAPGQRYAETVAATLRALGCTVAVIDGGALGLEPKGDAVDWLAAHPNPSAADILALPILEPAEARDARSEPEPLRRPLPPAAAYPIEALGPILEPAARVLLTVVQAPDAVIGASLLAAASLAAQPHANVHVDGRTSPISLWHVSIAESGERKSAVDNWALHAHREAERESGATFRNDMITYKAEKRAYDLAVKRAEKNKDAAATRAEIRQLGPPPDAPLLPFLLVGEPTTEALHKLLIDGRGSVGLFSDDAGEFVGGHAMSAEHKTKTAASLSRLWDKGEFDRIRVGDGASKHYGKRTALHLLLQPVIAESVLSDEMLTRQGFLARCLLSWPPTRAGTREYVERDLSGDAALAIYWRRMRALLDRQPPLRAGTRNELEPRRLSLDRDAKALFVRLANGIEATIGPDGPMAQVRAWASKGAEQALRIAGVLALTENPDASAITRDTLERAGEIAAYHLGEAARIVGTASLPPEIRHAELILKWSRERQLRIISSRDLVRSGPSAIRTADAVHAAMAALERHGCARRIAHAKRREWELLGGDDDATR